MHACVACMRRCSTTSVSDHRHVGPKHGHGGLASRSTHHRCQCLAGVARPGEHNGNISRSMASSLNLLSLGVFDHALSLIALEQANKLQ